MFLSIVARSGWEARDLHPQSGGGIAGRGTGYADSGRASARDMCGCRSPCPSVRTAGALCPVALPALPGGDTVVSESSRITAGSLYPAALSALPAGDTVVCESSRIEVIGVPPVASWSVVDRYAPTAS